MLKQTKEKCEKSTKKTLAYICDLPVCETKPLGTWVLPDCPLSPAIPQTESMGFYPHQCPHSFGALSIVECSEKEKAEKIIFNFSQFSFSFDICQV